MAQDVGPIAYPDASIEPLDVIRANECESQVGSLSTKRFRRLFNEIDRLHAELSAYKAVVATLDN